MTIASIVPIGLAKPDEAVVQHLKDLLARAETGEVRGIVTIARLADESHDHGMAGQREVIPLLGQLARLQHRVQVDADSAMNVHDLPTEGA